MNSNLHIHNKASGTFVVLNLYNIDPRLITGVFVTFGYEGILYTTCQSNELTICWVYGSLTSVSSKKANWTEDFTKASLLY